MNSCKSIVIILFLALFFILSCTKEDAAIEVVTTQEEEKSIQIIDLDTPLFKIVLEKNITVDEYFEFINQLVNRYDSLVPYSLTEYLLIHSNDWIVENFADSDYYYQMQKGNFVYNQKEYIILNKLDTLLIPNEKNALNILKKINSFSLDINIPEYKLRILQGDSIMYTFPVRVGKVGERYMETVGREVKMKTRRGLGEIVKINRNPRWQNPVDGHIYKSTRRDDLKRTLVPRIPFLNPEINGKRWGQLIHPTTNPKTLGNASSNGCIGTGEGDAWRIYFHAPIGTKVNIRYDLKIETDGELIQLKDIYGIRKSN